MSLYVWEAQLIYAKLKFIIKVTDWKKHGKENNQHSIDMEWVEVKAGR